MANSYETVRAKLDDIIERYRGRTGGDKNGGTLTREAAIKLIKELGFTEGDAARWLEPKPRRL
jgi:hypothetical protein